MSTIPIHFLAKKKEAERIDSENQKLMERIVCSSGTINFRQYERTFNTVKEYKERREKKAGTMVMKIINNKQKMMASAHSNYLPPIADTQHSIITRGRSDSPPKKALEGQKRS